MKSDKKTGHQRPRNRKPGGKQTRSRKEVRRPPHERASSPAVQEARRREEQVRQRRAAARKIPPRRPSRQREEVPKVVYTPARPFSKNRFLLQMVTLVAVVLALTFAASIFFKVKVITVSGNVKYDVWTVRQASGIKEGTGLLTLARAEAAGKIRSALPYVENIRIGIKLPDTVNIEIEERDIVYAMTAADETWWLLTAEGRILEQVDAATAATVTSIEGIKLAVPVKDQAQAYEEIVYNPFGDTVPPEINAQERMNVVLQILQSLEKHGAIGVVKTVDVTVPSNLQLWYGEDYQVKLGDSSQLDYKIQIMQLAFEQEKHLEPGLMDVSFSNQVGEAIFAPFREG